MRVSKRAVFLVLLFLHISPLCSNSFTTDDGQFAQTLAAELHAMEEAAKKYELHRTEEYKNAAAKHCANRIRDHMNEKTQKQLMTDFSKRLFPPSSCEPTSNPSHASDAHEPPCTQANPSPRTPHHANYNTHHPCVDAPYISSSGTSLVDKMGTASQRLGAYAQHRDRIEAQCSWAHNRSQALEKENKQIKFTLMHQKLPKDFQQSFEKRGLLEKAFAKGVERSQYKEEFYLDLLEKCGEYFTHEQLVQHQYAQMHRWKEYHNEEFRKFLQTFALYNDYVLEIDKHFKTCTGCCFKKVHACETKAYHCIANQAAALHKKYEQAKNQAQKLHAYNAHQRHLCMQEIFTSQMPDLDAVALEWQETRPERAQAYNETVANPKKLAQQKYTVSPEAADCLLHHGFDPTDYQELYGNPLQHELFRELLDGIEFLAQLPQVDRATPFDVMARTATLETFADARKVNEMGDCVGASKLIDFGVSLLEYSAAAVGGLGSGVWKGIKKTGTDIAHIVCHLDQVVMALGLVVVHFADLIYNYVPFDDVMSTTFDEQDCERIAKNWAKQSNKAVNWWKKTPAHDKMHQVVEVPVGFLTNAILFGCCASFASKLATAACAEALAITRKSNPAITSAVATSEAVATAVQRTKAEAVKLLERLSEAEQVAQAPALKLLNEVIYDPKFPQFPAIVETAWQMTLETLQLAVEYITLAKDTKKLAHVFHGKHNFNDLVKHFNGCQITTLREILKAASGKIPAAGRFENFQIQVFNQIVHIQGCVINNVPKLSTAFIKLVGKP